MEKVLIATVGAAQFAYTETATVTSGKNYRIYVTAYNQLGGESDFSEAVPV